MRRITLTLMLAISSMFVVQTGIATASAKTSGTAQKHRKKHHRKPRPSFYNSPNTRYKSPDFR